MKKTKFNVIDVIIVFLIIAIIAAGVYFYIAKFKNSKDSNSNTVNIEFTIEVNGLTQDAAYSFTEGDEVSFGESASGSGKIKKVEVDTYKKIAKDTEKGEFLFSEVPGEYTVKVTISSDVNKTDTYYKSGEEFIAIGREMPFNAKGSAAENCYIVDLKEVK
ncbi:MAG: DUF4330 family protein [Clostridia bacterium]|nr:DUF4330 family protein [Clostridia bacterium]